MKIVELVNHLQLPISNEEVDLLSKFRESLPIAKSELELREQMIASQLVNKGVLIRKNNNGKIEYVKHINN
jgi:hypothetical protein